MRSTLFFIPHEIGGLPVFGFGLLLGLLILGFAAWSAWVYRKPGIAKPLDEILGALPIVGIAAIVIVFLLPSVEQKWGDGTPIGLPIRGYGVMVVLGLFCGVGITVLRAQKLGISSDTVIGLGFWMMFVGVLGARIFYVIQKWSEFESYSEIFQLTEGGLVIYGGVIGGLIAGLAYCSVKKLQIMATADLIAPGFLIGQSLGRLGCLLHGCCFGGVCDADLPTLQFPRGSGPYQAQLSTGELLGMKVDSTRLPGRIAEVRPGSPAAEKGIRVGDELSSVLMSAVERDKGSDPTQPEAIYAEVIVNGQRYSFLPEQLPAKSLDTHPTQVYSAINAALLCLLIWFLQPLPRQDGVVFCVAILLYTSSRFLLELVRSDEAGQLGTSLTIAQWLSIGAILAAGLGLIWLLKNSANRAWQWRPQLQH